MPCDIFISYRIDDTLTQAGRLHQSLESHFGVGAVFYDKTSLQAGMKWPNELEEKVQQAKVVLLLYKNGDTWLGVKQYVFIRNALISHSRLPNGKRIMS